MVASGSVLRTTAWCTLVHGRERIFSPRLMDSPETTSHVFLRIERAAFGLRPMTASTAFANMRFPPFQRSKACRVPLHGRCSAQQTASGLERLVGWRIGRTDFAV